MIPNNRVRNFVKKFRESVGLVEGLLGEGAESLRIYGNEIFDC